MSDHRTATTATKRTTQSRGNRMKSRLTFSAIGAACTVLPLGLTSTTALQAQTMSRPANIVELSIGRGQLVNLPGNMTDVFVSNDSVADVQVKSQRQLYVFGKAGGEATVYASNAAGAVVWSANIRVGTNIDSVDQMLRLAMPEAKVGVATMGTNSVLLTGTVAAPEDAAEAERLVKAYMGEKTNVISRLRTATPLQVNLRVRFAEVSRSLVRKLGVNMSSIDGSGGFQFGIGQGREGFLKTFRPGSITGMGSSVKTWMTDPNNLGKLTEVDGTSINPITAGTTLAGAGRFLGLDLIGALDLAETDGLVTTLAQPNLTALSGETADFLAGGEFPIAQSQGLGTVSIEYKKYGISLAYTPTVLANGRISIRVRPEVSELSSQGAIVMNNFQVPALTVRRAETTVELGSGQSFMIAGLLSNNAQNTIDKAPGAGDLPILGALFRSTQFQRGQTELVIVVTPYLVNPVNDRDIKLPTDGYSAPGVMEQLLLNRQVGRGAGAERPLPSTSPENPDNPQIGQSDAVLPLSPRRPEGEEKADKKKRKQDRNAQASAAPGFSLN